MKRSILGSSEKPFFFVYGASAKSTEDLRGVVKNVGSDAGMSAVCVRVVRGNKSRRVSALFDEWAAAFQFPYYFGENWNAFGECVADLDWIDARAYVVILTNAERLLCDEPAVELLTFLRVLYDAALVWNAPVDTDESWARSAVPFHVIFQCEEAAVDATVARLASAGHVIGVFPESAKISS